MIKKGTRNGDYDPIGRLKYQLNVATLLGDDAYHATSAVDYSNSKEMRMAATVYIADIREDNVREILADYTQNYPPPDRQILLDMAGVHWMYKNSDAQLPKQLSEKTDPSKKCLLVE